MNYIDISPTISEALAVFPGDTPFSRKVEMDIHTSHLELSSITTSVHVGAHVDAPVHYHRQGVSIEKRDLDYYIGSCQTITVTTQHDRIYPKDIANIEIITPRVLFRTESFGKLNQWSDDFVALSPELIDYLASYHVKLVGIDTPSIDPALSKKLESHQAVFKHDMAILEGIVLTDVPDGLYSLIALPLKIKDADASPVRAILLPYQAL